MIRGVEASVLVQCEFFDALTCQNVVSRDFTLVSRLVSVSIVVRLLFLYISGG